MLFYTNNGLKYYDVKFTSCLDIIKLTNYQFPNYKVIEFDKFIAIKFGLLDRFVTLDLVIKYRKQLNDIYNNTRECFWKFGFLSKVNIRDLKFFQIEVGIEGPRHTENLFPVSVLSIKGDLILYDGYHRLLNQILSEETEIKCYILSLND